VVVVDAISVVKVVVAGTVVVVAGLVVAPGIEVVVVGGSGDAVVSAAASESDDPEAVVETPGPSAVVGEAEASSARATEPSPPRVSSVWPATSTGEELSPPAHPAKNTTPAMSANPRMPHIAAELMSSGVTEISLIVLAHQRLDHSPTSHYKRRSWSSCRRARAVLRA
jgi:hypothetical protein